MTPLLSPLISFPAILHAGIFNPTPDQLMEKFKNFSYLIRAMYAEIRRFVYYDPKKGTVLRAGLEKERERINNALEEKYTIVKDVKESTLELQQETHQKVSLLEAPFSKPILKLSHFSKKKEKEHPILFSLCRNQPEMIMGTTTGLFIAPKFLLRRAYPGIIKSGFFGFVAGGALVAFAKMEIRD